MAIENKQRLYVGLYRFGYSLGNILQPGQYHWALIIGPKKENSSTRGTRWLIRQTVNSGWRLEKAVVTMAPYGDTLLDILVRITIAKIKDIDRTIQIIESFGVVANSQHVSSQTWIQAVISALFADANACVYLQPWNQIEISCEQFAKKKIQQGRFNYGVVNPAWDRNRIPTNSMIEKHPWRKDQRDERVVIE